MQTDIIKNWSQAKWRIDHIYKIKNKNAQIIGFEPNAIQKLINANDARKKIILKARQFGVTTNEVIKSFDSVIWKRNQTHCILAHKREILPTIFEIVQLAYKHLPDRLKPRLDKGGGSRYEMRFPEINSKIFTALEIRGGTINKLHVSEAAFIPFDRLQATFQAVPKEGEITCESTPNGLNHFYDMWAEYDWDKLFFPWFLHSEYKLPTDLKESQFTQEERELVKNVAKKYSVILSKEQIAWRREKIKEFRGLAKFLQEYPEDDQNCFLTSGANPFDAMKLKGYIDSIRWHKYTYHQKIKVYKTVDKAKTYVIGADPAEGVNSDYSAASVWCVEDREQVAIFREQCKPADFADILFEMAKMYYTPRGEYPLLIVERNNHGHAVILKLDETYNYANLWFDKDEKPGHRTTGQSRPLLIDNFIESIEDGYFKVNFKETLAECQTLVDNNGKIEAEEGKHDDMVIADALALKVAVRYEQKVLLYKNAKNKILV